MRQGSGLVNNRVTRLVIGLGSLIPVLCFVGWLLGTIGLDGESVAWVAFGVAAVWIALMTWWALRAPLPPPLTDAARGSYFAALRHGRYRPLEHDDDAERAGLGRRA